MHDQRSQFTFTVSLHIVKCLTKEFSAVVFGGHNHLDKAFIVSGVSPKCLIVNVR